MKKWKQKIKRALRLFLDAFKQKKLFFKLGKIEFKLFLDKNNKEESVLDNISSAHFESLDWYRNSHTFMFIEDTYHSVMPRYSFSKPEEQFVVRLENTDPNLESVLTTAFSDSDRVLNLADSFSRFVSDASQNLFFYGVSLYEVSVERDESGNYTSIDLNNLMPLNIKKISKFYIQYLLPSIARKMSTNPRLIVIPSSKILRVQFPQDLGGRRRLRKILRRLEDLHREIFPKFHLEDLENKIDFDSKGFSDAREKEAAILVRKFGWDQRESLSGKTKGTEYFTIARALKFEEAMAAIRASILQQLNNFLRDELKVDNQLVLEGLPTVESVKSFEDKLWAGDINVENFVKEMRKGPVAQE